MSLFLNFVFLSAIWNTSTQHRRKQQGVGLRTHGYIFGYSGIFMSPSNNIADGEICYPTAPQAENFKP